MTGPVVHHLLDSKIPEIVESWITCVKKNISASTDRPRFIIQDHIPDFLHNIVIALKFNDASKIKEECFASRVHGEQRSRETDYSLNQLIYEYHLLRTVIFDFLDEKVDLKKEERNILNEMIDRAIREASVEFEARLLRKRNQLKKQHAILSSASDYLFIFDEKFRFTYANKPLLDLWGLTEEEALNKTTWELGYAPEVARKLEADAAEAFKGKSVRSDTAYMNFQGKRADYQYVLSPIRDEEGRVTSVSGISRDITEQKNLEKQLESARKELYEFFMQAPAPLVIMTGNDFRIVLANPPYENLIGRKVVGRTVLEVFAEEEVREFLPLLKSVYEKGESHIGKEAPIRIRRLDGTIEEKYLSFGYHPFVEHDGTTKGVLAVVQDVTEQVLAREKVERNLATIREKNHEILDILNNMSDGFVSLDKEFRVTQVNNSHVTISQIPAEEQLGKVIFDLFPGARSETSKFWINYHQAMKERKAISFFEYYDELKLWTAVNVYPKSDGGLAVFYRNVTEEKKVQAIAEADRQKFEAIFFDSPASMALLRGEDFIFEKINPKYQDLFRGRDILDKPLTIALPELKGGPLPEIMKNVFETGESFIGQDLLVPLVREAGGPLVDTYFDFTYSRIADGYGNPYGVYIHAVEVTDKVLARKAIEETTKKLQDSEQRLREAVLARDEFLSIASHELKTPLTSLKLQIQSAARKTNKPNRELKKEDLQLLFEKNTTQVNRLIRLVDDMLDLSRIQLGKLSYHFQKFDLCTLLQEVQGRFIETFEENQSSLALACSGPAIGVFDRERIEQVVINLLTNALKYGQGTPVTMNLDTVGQMARIRVHDEGIGIKKDNFERIFQRFERLVSASEVSGLGVGLYISKQIVDAHEGKIYVESRPGQGTTFVVELPLKDRA